MIPLKEGDDHSMSALMFSVPAVPDLDAIQKVDGRRKLLREASRLVTGQTSSPTFMHPNMQDTTRSSGSWPT